MISLSFDKIAFSYLIGCSVGGHIWRSNVETKYLYLNFNQLINAKLKKQQSISLYGKSITLPSKKQRQRGSDGQYLKMAWRKPNSVPPAEDSSGMESFKIKQP